MQCTQLFSGLGLQILLTNETHALRDHILLFTERIYMYTERMWLGDLACSYMTAHFGFGSGTHAINTQENGKGYGDPVGSTGL